MILASHLAQAVDDLVPPDRPLMLHASLRSFAAPIAGGADTLLDVLLTRGRTVMVPAFTEPQFGLAPPATVTMRPGRNGIDYTTLPPMPPPSEGAAYTVDCGLINPGLGALPAVVVNRAGAVRGEHPLNSFAALGPLAGELIAAQSPTDVYSPIRELAVHAGLILLVGVGLNRMTALHLAEQQSGRRLFLRWARASNGQTSMFEVGSCSEGFPRLDAALRPYARTAIVKGSMWRAYPAKETVAAATAAIRKDQAITRCPDNGCLLCRDSTAGGPIDPPPISLQPGPLRPEALVLGRRATDRELTLEVALVEDLGSDSFIYGHLAGDADSHVIVRASRDHPRPGEVVKVKVDTAHLHLFDGATGLRVGE
jgi:aminoglycoside N3'-acetyltransferase